jgi:hypothetical protein
MKSTDAVNAPGVVLQVNAAGASSATSGAYGSGGSSTGSSTAGTASSSSTGASVSGSSSSTTTGIIAGLSVGLGLLALAGLVLLLWFLRRRKRKGVDGVKDELAPAIPPAGGTVEMAAATEVHGISHSPHPNAAELSQTKELEPAVELADTTPRPGVYELPER